MEVVDNITMEEMALVVEVLEKMVALVVVDLLTLEEVEVVAHLTSWIWRIWWIWNCHYSLSL